VQHSVTGKTPLLHCETGGVARGNEGCGRDFIAHCVIAAGHPFTPDGTLPRAASRTLLAMDATAPAPAGRSKRCRATTLFARSAVLQRTRQWDTPDQGDRV